MKMTAVIGGITVTLLAMAGCIVFCIAGSVFILRYVLPLALLVALIKVLFDFIFGGLLKSA